MEIREIVRRSIGTVLFEKTDPDSDPVASAKIKLFDSARNVIYESDDTFDMFYMGDESSTSNAFRIRFINTNSKKGEPNNITGLITFPQSDKDDEIDVLKINPEWIYKFFVENIEDTVFFELITSNSDYKGVEEDFELLININLEKIYDKSFISQDDMVSFAKDKASVDRSIDKADDYLSKFGMSTKTKRKPKEDTDDDENDEEQVYILKLLLKGKDDEDYEILNKPFSFKHNMAKKIGILTGKNIQLSDDRKNKYDDVRILFDSDDDRLVRGSKHKIKAIYTKFDGRDFSRKLDMYDTIIISDFDKK